MAFKAVVKEREDGDYDVIAAFNVEMLEPTEKLAGNYAEDVKEWLDSQNCESVIIDIANVTDVIARFYIHGEG